MENWENEGGFGKEEKRKCRVEKLAKVNETTNTKKPVERW